MGSARSRVTGSERNPEKAAPMGGSRLAPSRSTRWTRTRFGVLALSTALAALGAVASPAGAVPSRPENGRTVRSSGRTDTDATARLHLLPVISNTSGGGTVGSPFVPAGGQYRHPSWSPDRTKGVFANGPPGAPNTEHFELFVWDFEDNSLSPLDLPATLDPLSDDRPAWAPDGAHI